MNDTKITIQQRPLTMPPQSADAFKSLLGKSYLPALKNYLGNEQNALRFCSGVVSDLQRNPKLLECTQESLLNSYMMMASCGFHPSAVSGEAYVLPYKKNTKVGNEWHSEMQAQFQMGYKGLVTLIYKVEDVTKIGGAIVHAKDETTYINGEFTHKVDINLSMEERGEPIGAYTYVTFRGETNTKYMNAKDILAHAAKFSKSYDPAGKNSPWNPENDPNRTMWLKTVLINQSKLLPKNETINRAINADYGDSKLHDRIEAAKAKSKDLSMGNLLNNGNQDKNQEIEDQQNAALQDASGDENQDTAEPGD